MGLLLYKSDEMYSSTELIRKSKMIFDRVLNDEIDKAIIMRDGKPSFLLMEFKKYENIMEEFEELKEYVKSIKNTPSTKIKKNKIKKEEKKNILKEELIKERERISIEAVDYTIDTNKNENEEVINNIDKDKREDIVEKTIEEISEEDEIHNALKSIESMNFNDEMKKVAQQKIKDKILQQRKKRAEQLAFEAENIEDEEQEELEIEQNIEEEKIKKERELKEFWD
jgi:hypothetical protein